MTRRDRLALLFGVGAILLGLLIGVALRYPA